MDKLIIEVLVGYMLKVMKSDKEIINLKNEFTAIRHGNYDDFIELVQGPIPIMVVYNAGVIKTDNITQKLDFDFAALIKAGPSMVKFYKKCKSEYGNVSDPDLDDEIFEQVALFEIGLRMHANNHKILNEKEELKVVIDKIGKHLQLSKKEIENLHKGRDFLNMIKHRNKKFDSWEEGTNAFFEAKRIIDKYKLRVK